MKYMVLGAGGLMGRHVQEALRAQQIAFSAYTHADLDIRDAAASARAITHERPDWVINCAALCSFDRCEDEPALSESVNLEAPRRWAALCHSRGARLAHFSSDYIFDGAKRMPYTEEDTPTPKSVYARHKAETESTFAKYGEHLILRVAWLFGKDSPTFMSQMPRLLMTREELTVASGKRGSCLYAGHGAELILALTAAGVGGIVNTVHSHETAWEEFARTCLSMLAERGLEPMCRSIVEVPFDQMPGMRAGRPPYSVLDTAKITALLGNPPTDWREGLEAYLDVLFPACHLSDQR